MKGLHPSHKVGIGGVDIGLIDNDPYVRTLLQTHVERLDASFRVIWAVANGASAIHHCLFGRKPQVLVLDMSLNDMSGPQVCRAIRERTPAIGIVGITALDPEDYRPALIQAGAQALIAKNDIPTQLRPAIIAAAEGRSCDFASGEDSSFLSALQAHLILSATPEGDRLSPQELAVMRLYRRGMSTKQIAAKLGISSSTVYVHVHQVMRKTGASTRQEALRICASMHVI